VTTITGSSRGSSLKDAIAFSKGSGHISPKQDNFFIYNTTLYVYNYNNFIYCKSQEVLIIIEFNKPYQLSHSIKYIDDVLLSGYTQGDGRYTELVAAWIKGQIHADFVLMMTSCTHALECALRIIGLKPGEEVIMPSFSYPSAANAVLLAGGKVVFSEIDITNLNLDPKSIEEKITKKTRAIVPIHYGGVSCDMDAIMEIANRHNLIVIEDAAQSFLTKYKNTYTGTIGHIGCFSFHGTKNLVAGEGGAISINDSAFINQARIFRQKGTNQSAYKLGEVDFYQWVGLGSSYSPNELSMALLLGQLELSGEIQKRRQHIFQQYSQLMNALSTCFDISKVLVYNHAHFTESNGHIFYMLFYDTIVANQFINHMTRNGIECRTHFVPLQESEMGRMNESGTRIFPVEQDMGKRLVRLPIYPDLTDEQLEHIMLVITKYFEIIIGG